MARRKNSPESVNTKMALAERLAALRVELFGERGGGELAQMLGVPHRTWYNYERGVTIPGETLLKLINLTSVEADWLLNGDGPKFRPVRAEPKDTTSLPPIAVGTLLRTALHLLENSESTVLRRDRTSVESETAHGSPASVGMPAVPPSVQTVRPGPWSEKSPRTAEGGAPHSRREA